MEKLKEILIEKLSLKNPSDRIDFLINRINESIKPPRKAAPDNVNIRVMYIVNDRVNSHGGRFRRADLATICGLLIDTPVLIGHNRVGAPLARNFHAELEQKEGTTWLKSYFYWPRAADGETDALLEKIDSGVLKECSISFTYSIPECSECGQDIRDCPHEIYLNNSSGDDSKTHFVYTGISQILETSLVYKGSVKGTYLSDRLSSLSCREITLNIDGRRRDFQLPPLTEFSSRISIIGLGPTDKRHSEIVARSADLSACVGYRNGNVYLLFKPV